MSMAETAEAHSPGSPDRALRIELGLGGLGAALILLGFGGDAVAAAGLVLILVATVLAAPHAPRETDPGRGGWWTMLAFGAGLSIIGAALSLVADTPGGLVEVFGGVLVAIGAVLGFPLPDRGAETQS